MGLSIVTRQAYTEIDSFIELLDEYNRNKVPQKLRLYFKENKDIEYKKEINPNQPIKEQNLKEETLALIAMLNLKYWCKSEEEKKLLISIYRQNEIEYQKIAREKYNPDEIFKQTESDTKNDSKSTDTQLIEYKKDSILKKIKRFILNIIKYNKNK